MPETNLGPGAWSLVEHLFRRQSAQLVATLTRAVGVAHLALVEEAVQDALVTALQQWPYRGVPDDPAAWLYRVARNRALDRLRHHRMADGKAPAVTALYAARADDIVDPRLRGELPPVEDDQLALMFLTCHPALPRESRVPLTLKIVGGFSVGEIARALRVQDTAVAQRLVRAKRLLRDNDLPMAPPAAADLTERLDSVLEAIYLMFNEGFAATAGDALMREDISAEAIRLASLLTRHPVTAVARTWALLALLLLHAARFPSRCGSDGELYLLRDQDRSLWDRALIGEGLRALDCAAEGHDISAYHLQAEIAACHVVAGDWAATDWPRILHCYDHLVALTGSPIVALNRAIAVAHVAGVHAAIAAVDALGSDAALRDYHLRPAVLAELWREAGDAGRAAGYYREALALTVTGPERRFLTARLDAL
jgi:RNA polymerase sigma-70 factor, ECF subfamily